MEEVNETADVDLDSAGVLMLEPGVCFTHHVTAMNPAHTTSQIPTDTVCIKGVTQLNPSTVNSLNVKDYLVIGQVRFVMQYILFSINTVVMIYLQKEMVDEYSLMMASSM